MTKLDFVEYVLKVEEICKIGLKYTKDAYAIDNYKQLQELTKRFLSEQANVDLTGGNFFKRDIYPTPNVSCRGIILSPDKKKVLLVQEKSDGGYSFPGGWTELTLSPIESVLKELREEAGAECKIVRLVGVTDRYKDIKTTGVPEYILTYLVEVVGEMKESCYEILSKDFFDIDNLPPISKKNEKSQMLRLIHAAIDGTVCLD